MERERAADVKDWELRRREARDVAEAAQREAEGATAAAGATDLLRYFMRRHRMEVPLAAWARHRRSRAMVRAKIIDIKGNEEDGAENMQYRVQADGGPDWKEWWVGWDVISGGWKWGEQQLAARLVEDKGRPESEEDEADGEEEAQERAARRRAARKLGSMVAAERRAAAAMAAARVEMVEAEREERGGGVQRRERRMEGDGRMGPVAREWYARGGTGWRGGGQAEIGNAEAGEDGGGEGGASAEGEVSSQARAPRP